MYNCNSYGLGGYTWQDDPLVEDDEPYSKTITVTNDLMRNLSGTNTDKDPDDNQGSVYGYCYANATGYGWPWGGAVQASSDTAPWNCDSPGAAGWNVPVTFYGTFTLSVQTGAAANSTRQGCYESKTKGEAIAVVTY